MKKLFLLALLGLTLSCSNDDDDDFNNCKCVINQRGNIIETNITDCSYNGRYISVEIGTKYECE